MENGHELCLTQTLSLSLHTVPTSALRVSLGVIAQIVSRFENHSI